MIESKCRLTANKREIKDFHQIALGNFFYPQNVRRNESLKIITKG